jgi:hypothetical protein
MSAQHDKLIKTLTEHNAVSRVKDDDAPQPGSVRDVVAALKARYQKQPPIPHATPAARKPVHLEEGKVVEVKGIHQRLARAVRP